MVMFTALAVGGGFAFIFNQLHPVFFTTRDINKAFGIPVLGAVSYLLSPKESRAKKVGRIQVAVVVLLLFASFALLSVFANQWSPVVRNFASAVS